MEIGIPLWMRCAPFFRAFDDYTRRARLAMMGPKGGEGRMSDRCTDRIPVLEGKLAAILGEDLAVSLIRAALHRGAWGLDMQLAINDGLESLPPETRARALGLIDQLLAEGRGRNARQD